MNPVNHKLYLRLIWFLLGCLLATALYYNGILAPHPSQACAHCKRPKCPTVSEQVAQQYKAICVLRMEKH